MTGRYRSPRYRCLIQMIRILIADDHAIVRRGIRQILVDGFSPLYIAEAEDTLMLIEKALAENWDIIISDLSMPGGGGLEAIRQIKQQKPDQPLLIVSILPEEQYAVKVLSMGASGYLNKDAATEELFHAVRTILSGRRYIQALVAEKLAETLRREAGLLPHELLSEREHQVLLKLASGISLTDIAASLAVSPHTISTWRARIMEKMDMKTHADIIQYAVENGLVEEGY